MNRYTPVFLDTPKPPESDRLLDAELKGMIICVGGMKLRVN